jgi:predicted phosphodiesterase
MRLAVLADIHGNLDALDAVLADLEARGGADKVWALGDLAAFCPHPAETLARIQAIPNAQVISGNTDRYLVTGRRPAMPVGDEAAWANMADALEAREGGFAWAVGRLDYAAYEYLSKLPPELHLEVPGYGWVVGFHAVPGDDEGSALRPDSADDEAADALLDRQGRLALCGHTHWPMDRQVDGWRVINPGSLGMPLDGDRRAPYAILDFDDAGSLDVTFARAAYDVDAVIDKVVAPNREWVTGILRTARPPGWEDK